VLRMTVLYPAGDDATFDWDYYTTTHMRLVADRFGPHAARPAEVAKGVGGVPKGAATYLASAQMYFADRDALDQALQAGGNDVPGDIPNFTNVQPVMQLDELME
jgi:uncharacterized protein (TIGR02118 family)